MVSIAVASPSFAKSLSLRHLLEQEINHSSIKYIDKNLPELSNEDLVTFLQGVEIAIIGKEKLTAPILKQLPNLKAICKYGVGLDNLDLEACKSQGINVYWQPGVNAQAVAEHTIALMINLSRNICFTDRLLHQGLWHKNGGTLFSNKTVSIIGGGHVGKKVAALAKAFGCNVMINDIEDLSAYCRENDYHSTTANDAIKKADFLTLHVPLTEQTKGFFDKHYLSIMKKSAFVINTSRGSIVNENDLIHAINEKQIAGAALDVFTTEPLENSNLYSLDNVILTPHTAGNAIEAVEAMGKSAIDGLKLYLNLKGN